MTEPSDLVLLGLGLLAVRLVFGLMMAAHGAQKLFGWFGGHGVRGTSAGFEMIGFRPGSFYAPAAGLVELVSGLLTALGLFGPTGPALMLSLMIVAGASVHWKNGFFAPSGIELNLLFGTVGFALALAGSGPLSLDWWLRIDVQGVAAACVALAVAAAGAAIVIAARQPEARPTPSSK
jgi:putative oxidoreductase